MLATSHGAKLFIFITKKLYNSNRKHQFKGILKVIGFLPKTIRMVCLWLQYLVLKIVT